MFRKLPNMKSPPPVQPAVAPGAPGIPSPVTVASAAAGLTLPSPPAQGNDLPFKGCGPCAYGAGARESVSSNSCSSGTESTCFGGACYGSEEHVVHEHAAQKDKPIQPIEDMQPSALIPPEDMLNASVPLEDTSNDESVPIEGMMRPRDNEEENRPDLVCTACQDTI